MQQTLSKKTNSEKKEVCSSRTKCILLKKGRWPVCWANHHPSNNWTTMLWCLSKKNKTKNNLQVDNNLTTQHLVCPNLEPYFCQWQLKLPKKMQLVDLQVPLCSQSLFCPKSSCHPKNDNNHPKLFTLSNNPGSLMIASSLTWAISPIHPSINPFS